MTSVERLRELLAAATPGPWTWLPCDVPPAPGFRFGGESADWEAGYVSSSQDAELLVAAVNALPALLALYDAARGIIPDEGVTITFADLLPRIDALAAAVRRVEGGA